DSLEIDFAVEGEDVIMSTGGRTLTLGRAAFVEGVTSFILEFAREGAETRSGGLEVEGPDRRPGVPGYSGRLTRVSLRVRRRNLAVFAAYAVGAAGLG